MKKIVAIILIIIVSCILIIFKYREPRTNYLKTGIDANKNLCTNYLKTGIVRDREYAIMDLDVGMVSWSLDDPGVLYYIVQPQILMPYGLTQHLVPVYTEARLYKYSSPTDTNAFISIIDSKYLKPGDADQSQTKFLLSPVKNNKVIVTKLDGSHYEFNLINKTEIPIFTHLSLEKLFGARELNNGDYLVSLGSGIRPDRTVISDRQGNLKKQFSGGGQCFWGIASDYTSTDNYLINNDGEIIDGCSGTKHFAGNEQQQSLFGNFTADGKYEIDISDVPIVKKLTIQGIIMDTNELDIFTSDPESLPGPKLPSFEQVCLHITSSNL
jgi:hypothetical protein